MDEPGGVMAGAIASIRRHPWMTVFMVGCTLLGAVLGYLLLGDHLSVSNRLAGGVIGGLGVGLLILATRMLGAFEEDDD